MNRIDRLFAILLMLQRRQRLTAREIASQFGVAERTIYRDMQALTEMGIPIAAQAGEGYELLEGFSLPPVAFTELEAKTIVLAMHWFLKHSTGTMQRSARTSLDKIEAVLSTPLREQTERLARLIDYYPSHPPLDWEQPDLHFMLEAIASFQVVKIVYRAHQTEQATERDIEPLRLTFSQGAWYVDAFCRLRRDMRSFRLNRIASFSLVGERFTPRTVFPVRNVQVEVRLRFEASVLPHVRERQHYGFLREEAGEMVYRVDDLKEIRGWVLGFGRQVETIQPGELREWLRAEAESLIRLLT